MVSSLISVRELIIDAFCLGMSNSKIFHKDFRMKISARVCAECPSLAEARAFMERHRFEGAALEELANAIQAEAILCVDDHQANLALEAEGVFYSDFTPEPTDDKNRKICVDDHRANLALEAEGVLLSDLTPELTDNTTFPRELADVIEAKANKCVDDGTESALEAAGANWPKFTLQMTDNEYTFVARTKLGGDITSKAMERIHKDAIASHDQKVSAGGFLASATSADVELPLKVLELGPFFAAEGLQMPRAVQPRLLSPEHLAASVPAAPNISYQRSHPTIDGVKCALKGFLRDANPGLSPWPAAALSPALFAQRHRTTRRSRISLVDFVLT